MESVDKQGRYSFGQKLLSTQNGDLFYGSDLSLRRNVLLYRLPDESTEASSDSLNLSLVSGLTDPRFLHILDMGYDDVGSYAVLERRQGEFLHEYLLKQSMSIMTAIELVYKLGLGLREAFEEKVRGFSLAANNLWLSGDNELLIINYWSEGLSTQRGVVGLIHLLYELITSNMVIAGGFDSLEPQFRSKLKEIPEETADSILRLLKQTYLEQYSLSSFLVDLSILLQEQSIDQEKTQRLTIPSPTPKPKVKEKAKAKPKVDEPISSKEKSDSIFIFKKKRYTLLLVAAVLLFAATFAIVRNVLTPASQAAPSPTLIIKDKGLQAQPVNSTPSDSDTKTVSAEELVVPNLQGLSQAEAEKQSLAAGIHYKYFIEPNSQAAGTVFKQDLPAGKKVTKDAVVTFWVSKGNG